MTISDIVQVIYRRTKTNSSSYAAADMLIAINTAYDRVAELILRADARWQWDDDNQTDLPIATTTLTASQQDYSISITYLTIDRIEVKDSGGNWTELTQIDQQLLKRDRQTALGAYQKTPGIPTEYDVVGTSVFLYPPTNYTQAASLKVYFTRGPAYFSSAEVSTGTKKPGFNALFHDLIPLWVSYEYAVDNGLDSASGYLAAIQLKEKTLDEFYGRRNRDSRPRLAISTDSNK